MSPPSSTATAEDRQLSASIRQERVRGHRNRMKAPRKQEAELTDALRVLRDAPHIAPVSDLVRRLRDERGEAVARRRKPCRSRLSLGGRYWARTSDPQLVELVLSQLS